MREHVVPTAQIITPNQFELTSLTGLPVSTMEDALTAADAARGLGTRRGVDHQRGRAEMHRPGTIDMVAVDADGAWLVSTPRLPRTFTGSGDVTAADLSGRHAAAAGPAESSRAHGGSHLRASDRSRTTLGRTELALIAAQDELIHPSRHFEPVRALLATVGADRLSRGRPRCWRPGHSAGWQDPHSPG